MRWPVSVSSSPLAGAAEKLHPQRVFKLAQLSADGLGRDVQHLARPAMLPDLATIQKYRRCLKFNPAMVIPVLPRVASRLVNDQGVTRGLSKACAGYQASGSNTQTA